MRPLDRRRFVGLAGLAAGSVAVSTLLGMRLLDRPPSIVDTLDLEPPGVGDDLLELGRAVLAISPQSVERLAATAADPAVPLPDMLAAAARSDPSMAPVTVDGWLLADPVAGVAGALARAADQH